MSTTIRDRRKVAEVCWGGQPGAVAWVGDRTLHSYWPVLASYFRDVLLPPHRREEEQVVAWQWVEVPGAPSAVELATLRQRLQRDGGIFAEALEAGGAPGPGRERRAAGGSAELAPAVQRLVGELVALADAELAARLARTENGLRLHSWGTARAASVNSVAARGEAGRAESGQDAGSASSASPVASVREVPSRARRRRLAVVAAVVVLLAAGGGVWSFLPTTANSNAPRTDLAGERDSKGAEPSPRRTLVHAGDHREGSGPARGPVEEVTTIGSPRTSGGAVASGARSGAADTAHPVSSVPAGDNAIGNAAADDIETSREVAVARDTARPAPGAPASQAAAVTAGSGAMGPAGAATATAGAAGGPQASSAAISAGAPSGPVAGDAQPQRSPPPSSPPPPRRPVPPVSPPAGVGGALAAVRASETRVPATAPAPRSRSTADEGGASASGRGEAVSKNALSQAPAAGLADAAPAVGAGPVAGVPEGSARRAGRSKEGGRSLAGGGTVAAHEPKAEARPPGVHVVAAHQRGHLSAAGGRAEAGLPERWSVEFEPAGTRRVHAVILPTVPLPEDGGETMEALRERMRREVAGSCPALLRAPRWRHAVVLAAPDGEAGAGWNWRTVSGAAGTARMAVEDGRAVWEAPPAETAVAGRWRLLDGSGAVRAEVETCADHSLRVAVAPGVRAWQRLALASEDGAARPVNELGWQSPSGGALPPAAHVVTGADTPAGGWIELPLAADRALVPDSLALVDRRTGWAALVRRRAVPAELTATR